MGIRRLVLCGSVLVLPIRHCAAAAEFPAEIISLAGREVPSLLGSPPAGLTASAVHGDTATAVHLQIDQRARGSDGHWQYVFETGEANHNAADRGLGEDDLVLLDVEEAGTRMQAPPAGTIEVEIVGADGNSRWFYLERGVPTALPSLLTYDPVADRVRGADYVLGFSHGGTPVVDTLILGDPDHGTNIIDRSKARLTVDLALGIGRIARTEDDVRIRTTGLHRGPLRIIRECEVRGRMLFGIYSPPVRDNFIFYAHGFSLPTTVRLTPTARMLTRSVTLRISMDLIDASAALTFQSSPDIPRPVAITGRGGARAAPQPMAWYLLRRSEVGLLGWLDAPDQLARDVTVYYRDDRSKADPPEGVPGEIGDHGFLYRHTGPLPAGDVRLSSYAWILHGSQLDRPADELRAVTARPTVRVH